MQGNDECADNLTRFQEAITAVDATAWAVLTSALQDGQAELDAADPNDAWNVTARFLPRTGQFSSSNKEGQPSLPQSCFPSDIVTPPHAHNILENVAMGHGEVIVLVSMVPYLRAGHEATPHALARTLLGEAQRVVDLGLWVSEPSQKLLKLWRSWADD